MGPAWETNAPGGDGRIPFTFRIGVTGHRDLANPDELRAAVRKALRGLIELLPVASAAGLTPVVVSALAGMQHAPGHGMRRPRPAPRQRGLFGCGDGGAVAQLARPVVSRLAVATRTSSARQ